MLFPYSYFGFCRHKCSLWCWNPFYTLCCQSRWMAWAFYIGHFCNYFILYWAALAFLPGQWTWAWDVSWYWPSCIWYYWTYCHFSKSSCWSLLLFEVSMSHPCLICIHVKQFYFYFINFYTDRDKNITISRQIITFYYVYNNSCSLSKHWFSILI